MTVLVFGTVAYDDVETPSGARTRQLGGSASYFAVAASYFCDVAMVSVVGNDFEASDLQLFSDHGIDTSGVEHADGMTFHWAGRYTDDLNSAQTIQTDLNVLVGYEPSIKDPHARPDMIFLGEWRPRPTANDAPFSRRSSQARRRRHHESLDNRKTATNWSIRSRI